MRASLLLVAAGLLALAPLARGQEPDPALLEAVEVGFGGAAAWRVPAPVWVTLVNPRRSDVEVRVVARSGVATAERSLHLPAGARKRVALSLVLEDEAVVEVRQDGRPLAQQRLVYETLEADRHLLVLDGRPPAQRAGATTQRDDQVLRHTTLDAGAAPLEAACYMAVAGVLLREADPSAWSLEQREALLEWVREGGLLLLADVTPRSPALARFYEGLAAGPAERQKLAGRAARARRAGLGTVVAFADDPLLAAATQAEVKQRLGELLSASAAARRWPRPSDDPDLTPLSGPGARTQVLVAAFVVGYFLAVGPLLALALRRARRARLALVTAGLVLGFSLLAPVVAGVVRTGRGEARLRSVLWVPAAGGGPALELGEVVVLSGGATSYRLELEGRDGLALAATAVESWTPADQQYRPTTGWVWTPARPATVRTTRGGRVDLDLGLPPWGAQRVFTHTLREDARPISATLTPGAADGVCTIENTSGVVLQDAMIVPAVDEQFYGLPRYVLVGDLPPGARREVSVPRTIGGPREWLGEALGLPRDWRAWLRVCEPVEQQGQAAGPPRYRVVSRARPGFAASGPRLDAVAHGLRVDAVVVAPPRPRGDLGLRLTDVGGAVVAQPMKGGPGERAGVRPDDRLLELDGERLRSTDHLLAVVRARSPGEEVTLLVVGVDGARRQLRVRLARAPR